MDTNCAPLLTDLFLRVYEADFLQGFLKNEYRKLAQTFNSNFRYIDDVLSLNNSRFVDYLHRIYLNVLQAKDTTDTQKSYSCLDLHVFIEIDNGWRLRPKLFSIGNFPFITSPRFLCRLTALIMLLLPFNVRGWYLRKTADLLLQLLVSTFPRFVAIRNPYINRFTNHFSIHS